MINELTNEQVSEMRLMPVHPQKPVCVVTCCNCGRRQDTTQAHADLNGEPFKSYWCSYCVASDYRLFHQVQENILKAEVREH